MSNTRSKPLVTVFALTLAATNATSANSQPSIPKWVTAQTGPSSNCPLAAGEGTLTNPFFGFNGTTGAPDFHCRQTGPFDSGGKTWFVQRIHSLTTASDNPMCAQNGLGAPCLFDGIRVCSKQATAGNSTPAGSSAGGKGCGVYGPSTKFRKKP